MTPKNALFNEQFVLRWNNHSSNLSLGFLSCLSNKNLVDVTLAVEGQLIQAHKLVLSVCSSYFRDIFEDNPCQHPIVILRDIKCTEIDALLMFMYQGEVNIKHEELESFLKVAEVLKVKGLTMEHNTNSDTINKNYKSEFTEHANRTFEPQQVGKTSYVGSIQSKNYLKRAKRFISEKSAKKIKKSLLKINNELEVQVENENSTNNIFHQNENLRNENEISVEAEHNNDSTQKAGGIEEENDPNGSSLIHPSNSIETIVTYRLSTRGRPQLVHKGYVYNLTSRSEVLNRSHYRCAEQHRGCRGKCAVIEEQFMPTGIHEHNHAPGYQSEVEYKKKSN